MPPGSPLDAVPLWLLFGATLGMIALAAEGGYRLGRARGHQAGRESEPPVSGMVAAELGLLAFLLGFTFALATARYDARREVLLDESNAIGTAYLRAAMLPEPDRAEVRRLLRDYVDARLRATQGGALQEGLQRSEELHRELWTRAVAAADKEPRSVPVGLFIAALNEVIDLHARRVTVGLRSRIPTPVWVVLMAVAALSFLATGYHSGLIGTRRSPAFAVVALTFAGVIWLVMDLDRPQQGMLRVSQQPMIDLRSSMAAEP